MKGRRQKGFSLVEVIVALGLLAGVLIAIAGLFTIGGKQVKSGRTATEALSVARGILEEMDAWSYRQTYQLYGFDGTANNYTVDTRTNSYASKWQPNIDDKLFNGYGNIVLESVGPGTGSPPAMNASRAVRVTVTVHWDEGQRHRTVRLGTVRM
jgi:prepilin-type N-terminal cleavage/methylation domain-containing protein